MYCAYITKIKNIRKHSNADKLMVGECFGNQVIVGLDANETDLIVYFPTDGQLSQEYAEANNLLRKKDENGNNVGGYMDADKRNVTTIKLRGECSDGLVMPLKSLEVYTDITKLKEGDTITVLNGHQICEKYIPRGSKQCERVKTEGSKKKKRKKNNNKFKLSAKEKFPIFFEHADTQQLAYNRGAFHKGDLIYLTLKCHGTSARTSNSLCKDYEKQSLIKRIFHIKPRLSTSWQYISGTRRMVLDTYDNGFYGSNEFRKKWHDFFNGKLRKSESIYYEIVGYTHDTQTIMGVVDNSKTKDKEFIKQYGKTTTFSYGCEVGENKIFVYRMTMTNEDGDVVEYPWELVKYRCEQIGVPTVPEFECFFYTTWEDLIQRVEKYYDGADPIGKTHIREGVVVRIDNKPKFTAYKHKNFAFKCLEGICKADAEAPDMEEAEELINTTDTIDTGDNNG